MSVALGYTYYMKCKPLFSAVFMLMVSVFCASATSIEHITFLGLKKTKESYMQKVLARFMGAESETLDLHDVETVLQSLSALDATVEGAVLRAKIMTLSLYASYQVIAAEDYDGTTAFCHGPGGGLKLYLQKINFPACSLGVYYNVPRGYVQFGASIGVSF